MNSLPRPEAFKTNARTALADAKLRVNFRNAMDFLVERRAAHFRDLTAFERLRDIGQGIRQQALARLPDLLEQLEHRLSERGVRVHWAENADDANRIFLDIAQRHDARLMVKGKSMTSEEIELNHRMAAQGIDCVETDMGEFILQLDGDRPSHIIMPAIHKTREDVARILHREIPEVPLTDDVKTLIDIGRRTLRAKFGEARIGVTGVNFMIAETGSLVLVENEGNGRLCSSVPDVHIAIAGIEKVIERLDQLPPLYELLTKSATGQSVTTYLNILTGPRRPGEKDGPREMHLILLDNGRSQAYREPRYRETLQCIRCGACMNHCPVYARVGGLSYGTTYPGPLGAIVAPHMLGLDRTNDLPTASSLCGACGDVCPVRIPIPELLVRLREAARHRHRHPPPPAGPPPVAPLRGQGGARSLCEALIWRTWSLLHARPRLYRAYLGLATRLRMLVPPWQGGWTRSRAPLRPAKRSLRARLARKRGSAYNRSGR